MMVLLDAPGTGCSGSSVVASLDPASPRPKNTTGAEDVPDAREDVLLCATPSSDAADA